MQIIKQMDAAIIPHIVVARCRVCQPCVAREACCHKALVIVDRGEPPWIDASRCYGCRTCIEACPHGAVVLEQGVCVTPEVGFCIRTDVTEEKT